MAYKIGQARNVGLAADAEARTKIIPEGDPELLTCLAKAEKSVTATAAKVATSATADFSFGDHTPYVVFRAVGVERNLRTLKHLQQLGLVGVQSLAPK